MLLVKYPLKYLILFLSVIFLLSACSRKTYSHQGYIEGRYTYISSSVAGKLLQLNVARGNNIHNGQLLFTLEPEPEADALAQAAANFQQAQAQQNQQQAALSLAKITLQRQQALLLKGATDQQSVDTARSNYLQTQATLAQTTANLNAAKASWQQANWSRHQKIIYAPKDAVVFDTYYLPGETVPALQPVLSLLTPQDIQAIFFVPEKELSHIHLNDMIQINCDTCKKAISANINFISPSAEFTPPLIYSNETNDKLVYRIEASFATQDATQFHPGQPVSVKIHEKS